VGVDEGVLSGGNRWTVLLLLKLGDGLVDKTEEAFGSGEVGRRGADVVSGGLWDDGGVGQWVDQQDAGRNGVGVPRVTEDGGEEDGGLGGSDGGDEGGIVILNGRGGATWGRVVPGVVGRSEEIVDRLIGVFDVALVDVVKV